MDVDSSMLQLICQGVFIAVLIVFLLNWITSQIKNFYNRRIKSEPDELVLEQFRVQQAESRQHYQQQHEAKSADYVEKILKPRQEERLRKKEIEFQKSLGQAWKGKGSALGGENSEDSTKNKTEDKPDGQRAAEKRKVPEQINEKVAAAAVASAKARQRPKRVIALPEEPGLGEDGVICVMLRTPFGTPYHRRFYCKDKIQCLLDFMTTLGFSQKKYTISTSFPRKLIEDPDSSFLDYNFGKRIALNVEERE